MWRPCCALVGASGCVVRFRRSLRASQSCLGGFSGWLVAPSPTERPRSAVRYILDFPQSSPSLSTERFTASPTPESSTTVFQVHRGGSNPLSSLSLVPTSGVYLQSVPGLVCLSV